MDGRIRLLQDISIFGGVRKEALALLLERVTETAVREGERFFREGGDGVSDCVLERRSGSIREQ